MVSSVHHSVHHSEPITQPVIMATSPVASSPVANLRPDGQPRNHYRAHSNSHPPLAGPLSTYSSAAFASQRETVDKEAKEREEESKRNNRVLTVLMRRLGHSKTFGENIIFMLNRSRKSLRQPPYTPLTPSCRGQRRRPLRAIIDPQNPLPALHDTRHTGILFHERSACPGGRVYSRTGGSSGRKRSGKQLTDMEKAVFSHFL